MENKEKTTVPEEETTQTAPETAAEKPEEIQEEKKPVGKEEKPKKEKKEKKKDAAKEELEKLKKELAESKDTYQRMLAEYANYKRRTEKEKAELGAFTKSEMLKSLLPSVDNMERAAAAPDGVEYKTGVDMVMRQFVKTLMDMGLEEIPADGETFNPEWHQAVMREDAEGVEADTVTAVFQKGYTYGGKVLRPAMVKVAN